MRAQSLRELLNKNDRVAVSNITGREASKVSAVSQRYCGNIVAGWALGKAGQTLKVHAGDEIPIFGQFEELMNNLPADQRPNKVVVYSPPDAVYGDVKEVCRHGRDCVETLFVITENVSIEVTAKLNLLARQNQMDIIGCNTLGMINAHEHTRVGAVGGDSPEENFIPGSACVISNSGNMVNTLATYLQSAGLGISYGISTGKDVVILTPLKELLELALKDRRTKMIVLYVEPGGTYEEEAIKWLKQRRATKPIIVYVAGEFAEGRDITLGHAGSVVDGQNTTASAKMALFDDYFGVPLFDPEKKKDFVPLIAKRKRGLRINTLHDVVPAAATTLLALEGERDFIPKRPLSLRPWIVGLGEFAKRIPRDLVPHADAPEPYATLINKYIKSALGRVSPRQDMRDASHASSNDGATPRIYGYSVMNLMKKASFGHAALLYWLGTMPRHEFEVQLFEMCLIASLTNGPGTISAQGAKIAASAGNEPNTAMMTTLGSIGILHGGNGKKAAQLLIDAFSDNNMEDPYDSSFKENLDSMAQHLVAKFKKNKSAAKDAGVDYERIPCLGHPVFNKDAVNYDPRERAISEVLEQQGLYNVFLDFYHRLANRMFTEQATNKVHAVNVDAAIACVTTAIAWPLLKEKKISVETVLDLPFLTFALGRVAGGAGEYLDHREYGLPMDMRVPTSECRFIGRNRD